MCFCIQISSLICFVHNFVSNTCFYNFQYQTLYFYKKKHIFVDLYLFLHMYLYVLYRISTRVIATCGCAAQSWLRHNCSVAPHNLGCATLARLRHTILVAHTCSVASCGSWLLTISVARNLSCVQPGASIYR